ncbi:unnamed protein product [Lota lota]
MVLEEQERIDAVESVDGTQPRSAAASNSPDHDPPPYAIAIFSFCPRRTLASPQWRAKDSSAYGVGESALSRSSTLWDGCMVLRWRLSYLNVRCDWQPVRNYENMTWSASPAL